MSDFDAQPFLGRRSDSKSAALALAHFGLVFAPVYLAAVVGLHPLLLLFWLWFGVTQNGVINLLHESAHGLTFKSQSLSRFVGSWVLGPLVLADFDDYRDRHFQHHRRLGMSDDPKLSYHQEIKGWQLFAFFVRCMLMLEGIRLLKAGSAAKAGKPRVNGLARLVRVALVQLLLLGSIVVVALLSADTLFEAFIGTVCAYGFVYGHGLGALTVFMAGLRAIAEHQHGSDAPAVQGVAALRNFNCGPLSRLAFGAYGFAEHATHHLEPAIPHYNLPAATDALSAARPIYSRRSSYLGMLCKLWSEGREPVAVEALPQAEPRSLG